ncbi:MAG: Eco57I restriction-modification methylase domain-containing protein [Bilifractor sp.]
MTYVYMFDVLEQIYTSVGYSEREAAKAILENNIYGLDIDDCAYQLAYFALMMKARQYNRRILTSEIKAHVHSIQESNGITKNQLQEMGENLSLDEKAKALSQAEKLVELFHDAKEYGSILNIPEMDWDLLRRFATPKETIGQTSLNLHQEASKRMLQLADQMISIDLDDGVKHNYAIFQNVLAKIK